jgi:hypothetical protein
MDLKRGLHPWASSSLPGSGGAAVVVLVDTVVSWVIRLGRGPSGDSAIVPVVQVVSAAERRRALRRRV